MLLNHLHIRTIACNGSRCNDYCKQKDITSLFEDDQLLAVYFFNEKYPWEEISVTKINDTWKYGIWDTVRGDLFLMKEETLSLNEIFEKIRCFDETMGKHLWSYK